MRGRVQAAADQPTFVHRIQYVMAVQQLIQTIMRPKLPTQSLTSIAVPIVSRMYCTDAAT